MRYKDVNEAFPYLLQVVRDRGIEMESRNGRVRCLPEPILLTILHPDRRVLFHRERRANPFFHLMEAIWMLAGRCDVGFVREYNKQMYTYSDDGETLNAAYGWRWRNHFRYDQLDRAAWMLMKNPDDRRVVVSMWDPNEDLGSSSLDIPCNTQIMFRAVGGHLDMTTVNRSNDLIWGLMGANCVHLTVMQEWVARRAGLKLGAWHHMTNNLHVYEHHFHLLDLPDFTRVEYPAPWSLFRDINETTPDFEVDCHAWCDLNPHGRVTNDDLFNTVFFRHVVIPMERVWQAWKAGECTEAMEHLVDKIGAPDWRRAARMWIAGRQS